MFFNLFLYVKLSKSIQNDIEIIRDLFVKTFTDSEGETEGTLIGNLVYDLMTNTDPKDIYGFVAYEDISLENGKSHP